MFTKNKFIIQVVRAFDSTIIRLYCFLRFIIIRQVFLNEMGQYLRGAQKILDIGCGFGLFSLYFSMLLKPQSITGVDLNPRRIRAARAASERLGLSNVTNYIHSDVRDISFEEGFDGAYMMDIIHHIPVSAVEPLLTHLHHVLQEGSTLLIKDVAKYPAYKRWFTYVLDKMMDYKTPVNYWDVPELTELLQKVGFEVYVHNMLDILPYPHVLYICRKRA